MGRTASRYSAKKLCSQRKNSLLLVTPTGGMEYSLFRAEGAALSNLKP